MEPEVKTTTLAETDEYLAWKAEEPDNETTYYLQMNNITINFYEEEWRSFMEFIHLLVKEVDKRG
jgi:hypothetical protein